MGRNTDAAAFKMAIYESSEPYLLQEKNMFELMKEHESIPKFYKFIPATIKSGIILVIELLGENLSKLLNKHKYFTIHTSLKIGLQAVSNAIAQTFQQTKKKFFISVGCIGTYS